MNRPFDQSRGTRRAWQKTRTGLSQNKERELASFKSGGGGGRGKWITGCLSFQYLKNLFRYFIIPFILFHYNLNFCRLLGSKLSWESPSTGISLYAYTQLRNMELVTLTVSVHNELEFHHWSWRNRLDLHSFFYKNRQLSRGCTNGPLEFPLYTAR